MRPRDERAHPVIQDAYAKGYLDTGADYPISGLASHAIANEVRLAVQRGQGHLGFAEAARVVDEDGNPCFRACQDPLAPHGVTFRLWSKDGARAHVFRQTSGDPANLKYNPWKRADPALVDDRGKAV